MIFFNMEKEVRRILIETLTPIGPLEIIDALGLDLTYQKEMERIMWKLVDKGLVKHTKDGFKYIK